MKCDFPVLSQILFVLSLPNACVVVLHLILGFVTFSRYGGKLSNQKSLYVFVIDPILWRYVKENKVLALSLNTDVKLFSRGN